LFETSPLRNYKRKRTRYALDHDVTLKEAALQLLAVGAQDFDRIVDPQPTKTV
jgi:hypothetical protein